MDFDWRIFVPAGRAGGLLKSMVGEASPAKSEGKNPFICVAMHANAALTTVRRVRRRTVAPISRTGSKLRQPERPPPPPRGYAQARRPRRGVRPCHRCRLSPASREAPGRGGSADLRRALQSRFRRCASSAPTSSCPPRTSASPARSARFSRSLMAPLGSLPSSTTQPSSIRRSGPNTPSSAASSLMRVDFFAEAASRHRTRGGKT